MGILRLLALSCALGLIPGYPFVSADPDVAACAELGFPAVACSTCKTIADIVADEGRWSWSKLCRALGLRQE